MEELNEKALNYATEKSNQIVNAAIAQAYIDGYRDGYKDREEEIPVNLRVGKTEYIDLGLPSGTLWSADYEKEGKNRMFLPYEKAHSLNIPTIEQLKELRDNCKWENMFESNSFTGVVFVGPNGNKIKFEISGRITAGGYTDARQVFFWLKDEKEGNDKSAAHLQNGCLIEDMYCGYKLLIRQVVKK